MATSVTTPKLTATFSASPSLQTLCRKLSIPLSHSLSSLSLLPTSGPRTLDLGLRSLPEPRPRRQRFSIKAAEPDNGAETARHYDFDLFTVGAGSGGVRASRFAANFGASVAVCELPFSTISSETAGGVGGT